ncbi:MAG: hypothetical protein ACI9BW_002551, partial [Gammaproteobacteria bacterium]
MPVWDLRPVAIESVAIQRKFALGNRKKLVVRAPVGVRQSYVVRRSPQAEEFAQSRTRPRSFRLLTRLRAQTINYRGQPVEAVFIPGMRDCRHVFDATRRVLGKAIRNLFNRPTEWR